MKPVRPIEQTILIKLCSDNVDRRGNIYINIYIFICYQSSKVVKGSHFEMIFTTYILVKIIIYLKLASWRLRVSKRSLVIVKSADVNK